MWNCGVTIVICVVIRVSSAPGVFGLGLGVHGPAYWLDFEDVDDYSEFNYEEYVEDDLWENNDDSQFDDTDDSLDSDTEDWQDNDGDEWQDNDGDEWQDNDSDGWQNETEAYDDDDDMMFWQDNATDLWRYNDSDWGQYNQTDFRVYNETEIDRNSTVYMTFGLSSSSQSQSSQSQSSSHYSPGYFPPVTMQGSPGRRWHRHEGNETKCPINETCARKCCPTGKGFDISKNICSSIPDEFNPSVWNRYSLMEGINASDELFFLKGMIKCVTDLDESKMLVSNVSGVFRLQWQGTLVVESHRAVGPELIYNTNKYCMDWFITAENETVMNAFICHVKNKYDVDRHFFLTGSCMLITCFLVLLRVVAFAWLPELRTLHGMILMAYLISFLVGFLLLGTKMLLMYDQSINREICVGLAFIVYFSILSAFFWRNVMCYDIWWTFSGKRAISGRGSTSRTRLYLYCAYAFGGPTALTIILAAFEYSVFPRAHPLMPKIHIHGCNSLYGYSKLIYFYGPIITLFVINMILFALTALKIAAVKKETKVILKSKESGTHDRKNDARQFTLYVKLFAAMVFLEVNWILEIVTIFYPNAEIVLQITDLYNVVLLLIILVNFLCQKRTWRMIRKRYRQMRRLPLPGKTTGVATSRNVQSQTSQCQDDTVTTDYSREMSNLEESQDDTQSIDYSREKPNPVESQADPQLTHYSRGKTKPDDNQQCYSVKICP